SDLRVMEQAQRAPARPMFVLALAAIAAIAATACDSGGKLPAKESAEYSSTVAAFYGGLAALQVGDDAQAESRLAQVPQLAPGEPAGWANWAALALRQRNFDEAAQRLERARKLAPRDAHVEYLLGILESQRGRSDASIAHLRKSLELAPGNSRVAYA